MIPDPPSLAVDDVGSPPLDLLQEQERLQMDLENRDFIDPLNQREAERNLNLEPIMRAVSAFERILYERRLMKKVENLIIHDISFVILLIVSQVLRNLDSESEQHSRLFHLGSRILVFGLAFLERFHYCSVTLPALLRHIIARYRHLH